jgi:MFS family permease
VNSVSSPTTLLGESWRAWVALLIGVLAVTAHSATSIVFSIVMKPILAEFGWGRTEFAGAMTARMLVMVAVIPFAGLFTDRLGARLVLAAGALVVGCGVIALSAVDSLGELYPLMAWMGPGQACLGSVAASALVLRLFRRRRAIAIGILNGGDNVINSLVPMGTTALLADYGWRSTLGTVGAIYVMLAALIAWALWPGGGVTSDAADEPHGRVSLRDLPWGDVRFWLVCLTYACVYAFVASQQLHFHAYQTDIGRTPEEASTILSVQLLVGAVGAPLFGWIAERTSARATLVAVVAGLAATSSFLWSPHGYSFFLGWAVVYGTVNSGVVALLALVLADLFGAARIGRLMGVAMVFCMSAAMLGNLYSAAMFDRFQSYAPVWQTYTALMVATLIPVIVLWRRPQGRRFE